MAAVTVSLVVDDSEAPGLHEKISPAEAMSWVVPPIHTVSSLAEITSEKEGTTVTTTGVLGEVQPF